MEGFECCRMYFSKMVVEYRHKIESGEIKEWEIGQE